MIAGLKAERVIDEIAERCCANFGFRRFAPLAFVRGSVAADAFLFFGMRKDARVYFAVGASIALRFPDLTFLVQGSSDYGIHENVPFHLLGEDHTFHEWQSSSIEQLQTLADDITAAISFRAIPFIDANSTLEALRTRLSSNSPRDWYVLSPEQRTALLAASEWVPGAREKAVAMVDEALARLPARLPNKRAAIESLRAKFAV